MKVKDEILRLRALGLTYSQIQQETGASKGTISYHCGEGQREKQGERQRDRRDKKQRYIQEVKQSSVCADCGENYPYWMMDFDHLRDKDFNISKMYRHVTMEVLKEEVAKCEIVCSNCHRNRTYVRLVASGHNILDIDEFYS